MISEDDLDAFGYYNEPCSDTNKDITIYNDPKDGWVVEVTRYNKDTLEDEFFYFKTFPTFRGAVSYLIDEEDCD